MSRKINDNETEIKSTLDEVQRGVLSPQDAISFLSNLSGLSDSEKTLLRRVMEEILFISQQKQQVSSSEFFSGIAPYSRASVGYSIQDELKIVANKAFSAKEKLLETVRNHIARGECNEIYVDDKGLSKSSGVNINSKVISGKNYQDSLDRLEKLASALRNMGLDVYHEQQNIDGRENAMLAVRLNDNFELQDIFEMDEQDFYEVARRNQEATESRQVSGYNDVEFDNDGEFDEALRDESRKKDLPESFLDDDSRHSSKEKFVDNVANVMRMQSALKAFKAPMGNIQTFTIGDTQTVEDFHLNVLKKAVASLTKRDVPSPSPAARNLPNLQPDSTRPLSRGANKSFIDLGNPGESATEEVESKGSGSENAFKDFRSSLEQLDQEACSDENTSSVVVLESSQPSPRKIEIRQTSRISVGNLENESEI